MELEFYQELLLTAAFSVLCALLISKIIGGDEERLDDAVASSDILDSGEKMPKPAAEELDEIVDGYRAEEELIGSERQIACVKGGSSERLDKARSGGMEMTSDADVLADEDEEEINAKEIVAAVVIDRDDADKEEAEKGEGMQVELCSSEVKVECADGTEIGSGRGEDVSFEIKKGSLLHGEDEWEGIEKSELEKLFGVAVQFSVSSTGAEALARLSRDVQMELYGFHKVAMEGPCNKSPPLPLKVFARARWHAWQKLGSMTPEEAMEQYISLLSKSIPGWIVESLAEDAMLIKANDSLGKEILNTEHHDLDSSSQNQLSPGIERKLEGHHDLASLEVESATGGLKFLEQGLTGTFLLNLLFPTGGALLSLYR
ncbi:acyl-CoA-binding domain-containing protein 3-like [Phalaenopsis equestris]|uniref:acyl-CoA-binding domain-containing protein 3-like n=1 Tax=Phalaenopsis equestris TaxID=78828 RepID=UPI0009E55543|nr:acyl-CoA-binding domain-containing protein 3-like [Phalaenopsis equestris]